MAERQTRQFASFEAIERERENGETRTMFAGAFGELRESDTLYPTEAMLRDAVEERTGERPPESTGRDELVERVESILQEMKDTGEYAAILEDCRPSGH